MMHLGRSRGLDPLVQRNLRIRKRSARALHRPAPPFLMAVIILAALGLAFVYLQQSSALLRLTAEREELLDTLNAARELNTVFADDLAHRHALPIVSDIARRVLGMVEPETVIYIVLQDDQP